MHVTQGRINCVDKNGQLNNYALQLSKPRVSMKQLIACLICLAPLASQSLEYEIQVDNESVTVARIKMLPEEEIEPHSDLYPQVVVALQGGVITRHEADGSTNEVSFPTGQAVFRLPDFPGQLHRSINHSSAPVELIIIQLKKPSQ